MRNLFILIFLFFSSAFLAAKTHVQIADENARNVVAVNVVKSDGSTFTGTGFVVSPDGLIATSRHVADNSLYMNITFNTGAVSGEAKTVASSDLVDLALLKIHAQNLPTVYIGDSDEVLPGQLITVIGNPRRLQNTISSGLVSQVRKKSNGVIWHQISAPISPSSSGSPVFNEEGEVVSVAFSSYKGEGNQNLNFSVPSNYLIALMRQLGYAPPLKPAEKTASAAPNKFWAHIQKSWDILKRMVQRQPEPKGPAAE